MSMSDPLADLLTRIRNAGQARMERVDVPHSNLKEDVVRILKGEGYIRGYQTVSEGGGRLLRVELQPASARSRRPAITGLRRVSTPGRRVYVRQSEIPRVMSGLGVAIISTSKGVVSDQTARALGVGGELLCEVW
ncbi:MAG: 30S ribosomal protein S8 [Thermodesulfobacteriota bacterium]